MNVSENEQAGIRIVALEGKLMGSPDESALSNLLDRYVEQGSTKVVLDLSKTVWMNSRGLAICISGLTRMRNRGGDLRLAAVPRTVSSLFEKCGIARVFRTFSTIDEAVGSF